MAKIAYGNKENIQDAIDGNVIPYDALVLTSDGNDAEMFFYDKDGNLKNIVNKTKFTSLDEAQEWILKYPCVGQNFTIYNGTGWGSYIVTSENILNPIATNTDIKNLTETKADKATTYTIAQTDTILSTKADKAYTYTKAEVQSKENELIEVLDEVLNQQENYSDTTWIPPIHPVFPSPSEPSIPDIDFEI